MNNISCGCSSVHICRRYRRRHRHHRSRTGGKNSSSVRMSIIIHPNSQTLSPNPLPDRVPALALALFRRRRVRRQEACYRNAEFGRGFGFGFGRLITIAIIISLFSLQTVFLHFVTARNSGAFVVFAYLLKGWWRRRRYFRHRGG